RLLEVVVGALAVEEHVVAHARAATGTHRDAQEELGLVFGLQELLDLAGRGVGESDHRACLRYVIRRLQRTRPKSSPGTGRGRTTSRTRRRSPRRPSRRRPRRYHGAGCTRAPGTPRRARGTDSAGTRWTLRLRRTPRSDRIRVAPARR